MSDFLPDGYTLPKTDSSYLKLQQGDNKFRILSKPIVGWVDWDNNKPFRFPMDKKPAKAFHPEKQDIKHFWAFVVWDYTAKKISIFELTLKSMQASIAALQANPDWGSPLGFDITINKKGSTLGDTVYLLTPTPPKPVHVKIAELYAETPINLQALFDGKDPFDATGKAPEAAHTNTEPDPFEDGDGSDLPF